MSTTRSVHVTIPKSKETERYVLEAEFPAAFSYRHSFRQRGRGYTTLCTVNTNLHLFCCSHLKPHPNPNPFNHTPPQQSTYSHNLKQIWDTAKYRGVLILGVSFKRGSTVYMYMYVHACILKGFAIGCRHMYMHM